MGEDISAEVRNDYPHRDETLKNWPGHPIHTSDSTECACDPYFFIHVQGGRA